MSAQENFVQGSLFEDDYLIKSLGNIVRDSEYALTELVANAWDAGATKVNIDIPIDLGGLIRVTDNGIGMTPDQFKQRWMKLGYNRQKHQGLEVEFPRRRGRGKEARLWAERHRAARDVLLFRQIHRLDEEGWDTVGVCD